MRTRSPKKILLVSHAAALGGAERGLLELAKGLDARGHQVSVLLPTDGPLADLLCRAGLPPIIIRYRRWAHTKACGLKRIRRLVREFFSASKLEKLIADLEPDIVITNTMVVPTAALAARRLGIPHIWYVREFGQKDHRLRFDLGFRWSMRLIQRLSDAIIVNCAALHSHLSVWMPGSRMDVVYNAVELDVPLEQLQQWMTAHKPGDADLRCTIVGRISPVKGQEDAIRAIASLAQSRLYVELTIVGTGDADEIQRLRTLTRELGVIDRVVFTGFSAEPLRYFCQADVALVCSPFEAFGRASVEALKCGCVVVATNRGGVVEHIVDGVNGFTYSPGDVAALTAHLRRLITTPDLIQKMAENSSFSANHRYNRARQISEVEAVLTRVLASR